VLLAVPTHGSDVDTWDQPLNADFVAIDGLFAGVTTVGLSSVPVTLTAPTGTPVPGAGPTQAQNVVIRFTGLLSADIVVTLPLPGRYVMENLTTPASGSFTVQIRGTVLTGYVALPPGATVTVYNDGSTVKFVDMGKPGDMELWSGLGALPRWVTSSFPQPYLLSDGSIYNVSDYPYLGARNGASFGGNGVSTFGVADLRGRVPLAYDGTGARITVGGCSLNGQVIGAAIDTQSVTLTAAQIPSISSAGVNNITVAQGGILTGTGIFVFTASSGFGSSANLPSGLAQVNSISGNNTINVVSGNTGGGLHSNVQPSQVVGIWVTKT
jgi:microcystin-dependent protein